MTRKDRAGIRSARRFRFRSPPCRGRRQDADRDAGVAAPQRRAAASIRSIISPSARGALCGTQRMNVTAPLVRSGKAVKTERLARAKTTIAILIRRPRCLRRRRRVPREKQCPRETAALRNQWRRAREPKPINGPAIDREVVGLPGISAFLSNNDHL